MEGTPLTVTKVLGLVIIVLIIVLFLLNLIGGGGQLFSTEQINEFIGYTESRINNELNIPSDGLEPASFLAVFPGISERDFDRVEGVVGGYAYEDGKLLYDLDGEKVDYAVAKSISKKGMSTLLHNIALRENIERTDPRLVEKVIVAIENQNIQSQPHVVGNYDGVSGLPVTIEGTVACLARKDTHGPQTLECVIGMHAPDGKCYGLRNIFNVEGVSFDIGQKVRVSGDLYPPAENNIYDIGGVINVVNAEVI